MTSAAAVAQHSQYDWDWLWGLLSGVGGVAALITLLLTIPTYVLNLLAPFKVTSAQYRVGAEGSMAITITIKNRQRDERSLTGVIIGQPPNRWKRLRPKWWIGYGGWKKYDIGIKDAELRAIAPGDSILFSSRALTRVGDTPVSDALPSNARVLAYGGASRPYVKRPKKQKIGDSPGTASTPPPETTAAPGSGPEPSEVVTPDPPAS